MEEKRASLGNAKNLEELVGRRIRDPQGDKEAAERVRSNLLRWVRESQTEKSSPYPSESLIDTLIHFYNIQLEKQSIDDFLEKTKSLEKEIIITHCIRTVGSTGFSYYPRHLAETFAKYAELLTPKAENEVELDRDEYAPGTNLQKRPEQKSEFEEKLDNLYRGTIRVRDAIQREVRNPPRHFDGVHEFQASIVERAIEMGTAYLIQEKGSKESEEDFENLIELFELIGKHNNNDQSNKPSQKFELKYPLPAAVPAIRRDAENFISAFRYLDLEFLRIATEKHARDEVAKGAVMDNVSYSFSTAEMMLYDMYIKKIIEQQDNRRESIENINRLLFQIGMSSKERIFDISDLMEEMYTGLENARRFTELSEKEHAGGSYPELREHAVKSAETWFNGVNKSAGSSPYPIKIIDVGCGDGTKAVAIAKTLKGTFKKDVVIDFADISEDLLHVARRNAYLAGIPAVTDKFNLKEFFSPKLIHSMTEDAMNGILFRQGMTEYFTVMRDIERYGPAALGPYILLFLGQTIGNFANDDIADHLKLRTQMTGMAIVEADVSKQSNMHKYVASEGMMTDYLAKVIPRESFQDPKGKTTYEILPLAQTGGDIIAQYTITKDTTIEYRGESFTLLKGDRIITAKSRKFSEADLTADISPRMVEKIKRVLYKKIENLHYTGIGASDDTRKEIDSEFKTAFAGLYAYQLRNHLEPLIVTKHDEKLLVTYFGSNVSPQVKGKGFKEREDSLFDVPRMSE
ncbi:L-histidine N(alpha)-methyltransferase [Candidatus Woesearchaeota archaeon]|nr:L-histidine N(alpha)-methyltransferase [Candidatus Woesearchaeota archaeon]